MNYKLYWELTNEGDARLLRAFGETPEPRFPAEIEGRAITEIGDYCFAAQAHLPAECRCSYVPAEPEADGVPETAPDGEMQAEPGADGAPETAPDREADVMPGADGALGAEPGADGALAELAGAYITRVTLPEGIKKIGNFAFYNATELAELELGSGIDTLGSDAFMNCRSLSRLLLHADPGQKTGLRLLLAQLSSDLEVALSGENGVWAKLLFPEYYESYDEIGPAHIFELNLTGEGFRARQCFKEGVILLNAYDEIFPQACVEESAEVLIPMAWNRLYAACGLSPEARAAYETYVREQSGKVLTILLKKRELKPLHFFFEKGYGRKEQIEDAVAIASHEEWMEGVASLIAWKRQLFAEQTETADVRSRYVFEEF